MNRIIILVFLLLALCLNADSSEYYAEVSEPQYALIYEANGLYHIIKGKAVSVEDGKYKFIDDSFITYLEIKNSKLNGRIFVFDKKTNKKIYEYAFRRGIPNGRWITYDSNVKPQMIENYVEGVLLDRTTFSDGKFLKREVFQ